MLETVLGLIGFAVFIVAIISLAAGVSWTVVKLTPPPRSSTPPAPEKAP